MPELHIDAEAMVDAGHVTIDEMDLITLGLGIVVDGATSPTGGCITCGLDVFDQIGARPGIVEAAMRVIMTASAQLHIEAVIAVSGEYDPRDPDHRKNAFAGLAAHWVDVVIKMRTCGVNCAVCINLGPAWPTQIGTHG